MKSIVTFDTVAHFRRELGDEEFAALVSGDNLALAKRFTRRLVRRESLLKLPVPLQDAELPEQFRGLVAPYRILLAEHKCPEAWPVAYRVPPAFTLKRHAPRVGPCVEDWQYLQDWTLQNDELTKSGIAFWIPRLLNGSTNKTVSDQLVHLAETRTRLVLPAHHLSRFGSTALLSGLVLGHFRRTGERVPLNGLVARSDTLHADGFRLSLRWFVDALSCGSCWFDGEASGDLGCFPLGFEELGS